MTIETMTQEARNAMQLPCKGAEVIDFRLDCQALTGAVIDVTWFGTETGDVFCFECARKMESMQLASPLALPTQERVEAAKLDIGWN